MVSKMVTAGPPPNQKNMCHAQRNPEKQTKVGGNISRKEQQPHLDTPPVGRQHNDSLAGHGSEQRHSCAARAGSRATPAATTTTAATAASSPHDEATKGDVTEYEGKDTLDERMYQKNGRAGATKRRLRPQQRVRSESRCAATARRSKMKMTRARNNYDAARRNQVHPSHFRAEGG